MKLTFDANNTKVYDNILDQTQFKKLFNFMNFVPMVHKRSHGEWNRVWGFGDGDILMANRYIWPPGSGLSWHNDSNYLGAFTFYCHDYWSPEWGGEFLTAEANEYILPDKKDIEWKVFDNQPLYDTIMDQGVGHYIQPKPNRLVLNKGGPHGILHKVNKSTVNSGPRITLQGFIRAKGIEEDCCSE